MVELRQVKRETAHFRLPSASQKRACLSSLLSQLGAGNFICGKPNTEDVDMKRLHERHVFEMWKDKNFKI